MVSTKKCCAGAGKGEVAEVKLRPSVVTGIVKNEWNLCRQSDSLLDCLGLALRPCYTLVCSHKEKDVKVLGVFWKVWQKYWLKFDEKLRSGGIWGGFLGSLGGHFEWCWLEVGLSWLMLLLCCAFWAARWLPRWPSWRSRMPRWAKMAPKRLQNWAKMASWAR